MEKFHNSIPLHSSREKSSVHQWLLAMVRENSIRILWQQISEYQCWEAAAGEGLGLYVLVGHCMKQDAGQDGPLL